jgi:polyhydroxybutyrate depolymerase
MTLAARRLARTAAVAVAMAVTPAPPARSDADRVRAVRVAGRERTYILHVPPAGFGREFPVVVAFHGGASNAAAMRRFSALNEKADRAGFVVVYPNGSGRLPRALTWNAGRCCGQASAARIDDVAFTRALLDDLAGIEKVDRSRVFATGMSNGGQMAYRLGVELSDRIAAIAPVAASLEVDVRALARPVPVVHFHGTDDRFLPFGGGAGSRSLSRSAHRGVWRGLDTWARASGCSDRTTSEALPDRREDETTVERHSYAGCPAGAEVVLYLVRGGGHTWPGSPGDVRTLGVTSQDISANDVMWEFFTRHPLRAGSPVGRP